MKRCKDCGEEKPYEEFYRAGHGKSRGQYTQPYCKECNKARRLRWHHENAEKSAVQQRRSRLRRLYGISLEEYDEMLEAQRGVCAICGSDGKGDRLAVDHDHETGNVLGLLCDPCNRFKGVYEAWVSDGRLEQLLDYLTQSEVDSGEILPEEWRGDCR